MALDFSLHLIVFRGVGHGGESGIGAVELQKSDLGFFSHGTGDSKNGLIL